MRSRKGGTGGGEKERSDGKGAEAKGSAVAQGAGSRGACGDEAATSAGRASRGDERERERERRGEASERSAAFDPRTCGGVGRKRGGDVHQETAASAVGESGEKETRREKKESVMLMSETTKDVRAHCRGRRPRCCGCFAQRGRAFSARRGACRRRLRNAQREREERWRWTS